MKEIPIRKINTQKEAQKFSDNFNIRQVKGILSGKDMVQDLHRHDFYYILVLEKGQGTHDIDFIPYKITNQCIFVLRPGQVHQLTLKAGSTGYLAEFKNDFYVSNDLYSNQVLRQASVKNFYRPGSDRFKKLFALVTHIFREYSTQQEGYQKIIQANLDIFFVELVRHRLNKKNNSLSNATYAQQRLEEFLEHLEKRISSHKEVSHYADLLNLSPYQLNAITKTTLGKTCSEVINEYCILEAKRYLLATSNQVNQIAYQLGYEDVSYFIRFFKKHTGYTPEAFRENFT